MGTMVLVAVIDGTRIALPACDVHSVIEIGTVTPVPGSPPWIAGLAAMRSRMMTVVDCRVALGLPASAAAQDRRPAVVVDRQGHLYALLIDEYLHVVSAEPGSQIRRGAIGAGWAAASQGLVEAEDGPALAIDLDAIIAGATCHAG